MRKRPGFVLLLSFVAALGCGGANDSKPLGTGGAPKGASPQAKEDAPVAPAKLATPPSGAIVLKPENSKIEFVGTKPDGKHLGGFNNFLGSVALHGKDFAGADLSVEIETDSLYADVPKLTGHLKTPDFFDVKTYPKASFKSTAVKAGGEGGATHTITGDLTLHDVTKALSFPAKVDLTDDALALNAEFKFNRSDYGITYNKNPVDEAVTVKVTVKASRK